MHRGDMTKGVVHGSAKAVTPSSAAGRSPARLLASCSVVLLGLSGCADGPEMAARSEQVIHDPAALMRLAAAAEQSGNPVAAAAFYSRTIALEPDLMPAQIGLAQALTAEGQVDDAIEALRTAHARAPSDSAVSAMLDRLLAAHANRKDVPHGGHE